MKRLLYLLLFNIIIILSRMFAIAMIFHRWPSR